MLYSSAGAGQESPTKSQLSSAPSQVPGPGGDKPGRPPNWTKGELIGQGAFGSVYLGMDNDSGQLMAVKQVHVSKAAERGKVSEHLKGLEAEVLLLQQLDHANIVRYLVSHAKRQVCRPAGRLVFLARVVLAMLKTIIEGWDGGHAVVRCTGARAAGGYMRSRRGREFGAPACLCLLLSGEGIPTSESRIGHTALSALAR
jgi:hypothetical protein